ncbi:hypothetical protein D9M69_644740 [compost metagenome]
MLQGRIEATLGDDLQAIAGLLEGQQSHPGRLDHLGRTRANGVGPLPVDSTTGQLRLDDATLDQPTQHDARPGLRAGVTGDFRHDDELMTHGGIWLGNIGAA